MEVCTRVTQPTNGERTLRLFSSSSRVCLHCYNSLLTLPLCLFLSLSLSSSFSFLLSLFPFPFSFRSHSILRHNIAILILILLPLLPCFAIHLLCFHPRYLMFTHPSALLNYHVYFGRPQRLSRLAQFPFTLHWNICSFFSLTHPDTCILSTQLLFYSPSLLLNHLCQVFSLHHLLTFIHNLSSSSSPARPRRNLCTRQMARANVAHIFTGKNVTCSV